MEVQIFLEEFFRHFASIELCVPVRRMRSNLTNSYKEIPVRLQVRG